MSKPGALIPFAGCLTTESSAGVRSVLLGIADDSQSSYRWGCSRAPGVVRAAYDGRSFNSTTESGVNLARSVLDLGDLEPKESWSASALVYRATVDRVLKEGRTPFVIGGDHAVSVPVVQALAVLNAPIHVIQVDAHPDLYEEFDGTRSSHGCVAARLLEMEHVASLTQLGIRTLNDVQSKQIVRFHDRLRILFARDLTGPLPPLKHIPEGGHVFLNVDLDGFDPSCAPGVSHPVPGGLTSRQVLSFIQAGRWRLAGMDVVECNPSVDINNLTAILAARLLHEGMGHVTLHAEPGLRTV